MTVAEFTLLKSTHDKVCDLAEAFAAHVAVQEAALKQRASAVPVLAACAAWLGAIVALVSQFFKM